MTDEKLSRGSLAVQLLIVFRKCGYVQRHRDLCEDEHESYREEKQRYRD